MARLFSRSGLECSPGRSGFVDLFCPREMRQLHALEEFVGSAVPCGPYLLMRMAPGAKNNSHAIVEKLDLVEFPGF